MAASNTHSPPPQVGDRSKTSSPNNNRAPNSTNSEQPKDAKESSDIKEEKQAPSVKQPDSTDDKEGASKTNAPLAPPPKPAQNGGEGGDYFSGASGSNNPSHFSKEPNPFENAFGSNPADTPGKTQLPGVTSLTSPASLLPANTPGWPGSLRSGPLSPAMLTGPTNSNDYFSGDHHFSGSFPTPNESSLRTGLTPGGGGSMFPQPSPNSQALYNSLQSGGATPGTLDFHRTAMTARANSQANTNFNMSGATSQPQQNPNIQPDLDSKPYNPNAQPQQQDAQDPFSSHQTNDAANGLFMLAQAGGQQQQQQQQQRNGQGNFGMPPQQPQQQQNFGMPQEQGMNTRAGKNSVASNVSGDTENGQDDYSGAEGDSKPTARSARGKKGSAGKGAANGKRKTEETPSKPNNKRQRTSTGQNNQMDMDMENDDDDDDSKMEMSHHPDGKKMTDEEKRKNFLERNRVAALKCRQRKKQWLANLQQKVEIFSTENDALAATVTQLREEIVGLKTLLLAHKDCPVSAAQGISAAAIQQIAGTDSSHQYANPYGMMGHGMQGQMQGQMQRS